MFKFRLQGLLLAACSVMAVAILFKDVPPGGGNAPLSKNLVVNSLFRDVPPGGGD